ncbi:MAG: hypothetical protein WBZ48_05815 [Bacteroidota bacterium]
MRLTSEINFCFIPLAVFLLSILSGAAKAQTFDAIAPAAEQFRLTRTDTTLQLSHDLLIPGTELVFLDSLKLNQVKDYFIDYSTGRLRIDLHEKLDFRLQKISITIYYNFLPFSFQSNYRHKSYSIRRDSVTNRSTAIVTASSASGPLGDIFGSDLQKSGSIFRGFSVGTNRDLTLNSGFRLQFSGKLSSDIEVVAALTDENTPIQPDGNTQTIQELDNVFVQIKSANYGATLGDFYLDMSEGEFGKLSRKLEGATGTANYSASWLSGSTTVTAATSRGKFNTNQFPGIEAVQGPYQLYGKNNENNIVIIAGTEKVYVDGILMIRGENNDYSIDYTNSQITFSSKRLITVNSRIVVDFQYTDQSYTRNFFSVQSDAKTFSDAVKLSVVYAQEGDDPNAPIDISLSDSDKTILAQSGSKLASRSGVDSVGVDSLNIGKGQYEAIDTVVQGAPIRIYRFAAETPTAQFNITFSYVGSGEGDYTHQQLGQYTYVGPHNGNYLPIIILPAPQLQQIADVNTSIHVTKDLTVTGEFAASNFNANTYAPNAAAAGDATKYAANFTPTNVKIAGANIGSFNLSLSDRYVDKNFTPIDRIDDVDFARKWSLDSTVTIQPSSQEIREAALTYSPNRTLSIGGSLGSNDMGSQFTADRKEGFLRLAGDSLPKIDYTIEQVTSSQGTSVPENDWVRQNGSIAYAIKNFIPSFRFEHEDRSIETPVPDSLDNASFGFTTLAPKFSFKGIYGMNLSTEFELRDDKAAYEGKLEPEDRSFTQTYAWELPEVHNVSSSLDVILRDKTFHDQFRLSNSDDQTVLVRSETRYSPFQRGVDADVYYETSTERSAELQRVFYQVQKGDGQYIWAGTGNVNVTDEKDFELSRYDGDYTLITIPTDQLFPVINVKTSTRLRLTPSKFISSPSRWFEKALTDITTESYVRIEEKSSDPQTSQIYLLDLSHFLDPATTILGSQLIQQDLFLFQNRRDLSFRFRYLQQKGAGQYSTGDEQSYNRERSVEIRVQLVPEISNQIDYVNKQNNVAASLVSGRAELISSDDIASDYSYRPEQNVEVGFKIEVSRSEDDYNPTPIIADLNAQSLRTVFSFQGSGQLRFDLSREEVGLENSVVGAVVPFDLTAGRLEGKTYLWGVSFDYKLSNNLQSSLQYTGRSEQSYAPVHTAKAEVRAFF